MGKKVTKWSTKEKCFKEAIKYSTIKEFKENCIGAYNSAWKNKWLTEITKHMHKAERNKIWTKELCQQEALKYKSRSEFIYNAQNIYAAAFRNGWLDEICKHMPIRKIRLLNTYYSKYTKEMCQQEALKYKYKIDFQKYSYPFYSSAQYNGWLKDICKHMFTRKIKESKYSFKICHQEALKYKSRSEFQLKSRNFYNAAIKYNWINRICVHMEPIINQLDYPRIIYAYIFSDKSIYVGLTKNFKLRQRKRIRDQKDAVTKYINKTGLYPEIKFLTEFIPAIEAQKMEEYYINYYKKLGYNILNRHKAGSLGGSFGGYKQEIVEHL